MHHTALIFISDGLETLINLILSQGPEAVVQFTGPIGPRCSNNADLYLSLFKVDAEDGAQSGDGELYDISPFAVRALFIL